MAYPPSNTSSVSLSRSRTSRDEIKEMADTMLRASLSKESAAPSLLSKAKEEMPTLRSLSPSVRSTDSSRRRLSKTAPSTEKLDRWPSSASTAVSASSATRNRLCLMELENEKLRQNVERLKREGDTAGLSAADEKVRIKELNRDSRAARAESSRVSTAGLFKTVCSTDLLFLIDTTSSMRKYIAAAKRQVLEIVDDIRKAFFNEAEVRIAVVGYKDHNDWPNIEFLDFTPLIGDIRAFIGGLEATGGADAPEDVLGGLYQALNASWKQKNRCIIHIADSPPHGRTLHDFSDDQDSFPEPGSEPHRLTHKPLLKRMIALGINYALLRIEDGTDRMAYEFFKTYIATSANSMLHKSNYYYRRACDRASTSSSSSRSGRYIQDKTKAGPLFTEAELGTSYSELRGLVVKHVTASASLTAVRISAAKPSRKWYGKKFDSKSDDSHLSSVREEESEIEHVELEEREPKWDVRGWLDEKLMVEGFSPHMAVHGPGTLTDMMAKDEHIKLSVAEITIYKRSRPFAQGAMRMASYARTAASENRYVVKSSKRSDRRIAHLVEDMRCQALCKAFALEFNALLEEDHMIDFIASTCFKGQSVTGDDSADNCLSLEPYLRGSYVKYNSNNSYVNNDIPTDRYNQAAQAFSHFTFERSRGRFLVCDLQGVRERLTDPAIHTLDPERFKLMDGNLGIDGFKFFFSTHECNTICAKLELQSNRSMIISGNYEFRTTWPRMDKTVCCSNKLCGKIVRTTRAKTSEEYPGHFWCSSCWRQLESFRTTRMCHAPGPDHEFDVSTFYYESQGRRTPRKCPKHREDSESSSKIATATSSLWAKAKSATKMKASSLSLS